MRCIPNHRRAGSVLLAAVGALLILLVLGKALVQQFASLRRGRALEIEASRAHWIAEAGVGHAIALGTSIIVPQPYRGGTYAVTKVGSEYTSTGTLGQASQTVVRYAEDAGDL